MPKIYLGVVASDYVRSRTVNTLISIMKNFPTIVDSTIKQGCLVHINREEVVKDALKAGIYTHVFFVDSDMCFSARVLQRLLDDDKDIVGANYNHRRLPLTPLTKNPTGTTDLFKTDLIGTGCMLIKTSVFPKLKRPWFFLGEQNDTSPGMGEDAYFCKKAIENGIDVWCDPSVEVGHVGEYIF